MVWSSETERDQKKKKKLRKTFLDPAQSEIFKLAFQRELELLPNSLSCSFANSAWFLSSSWSLWILYFYSRALWSFILKKQKQNLSVTFLNRKAHAAATKFTFDNIHVHMGSWDASARAHGSVETHSVEGQQPLRKVKLSPARWCRDGTRRDKTWPCWKASC